MATPLTPTELRAAIYVYIGEASQCINEFRRQRLLGEVQGLLLALTGESHYVSERAFVGDTLAAAGIPWEKRGGLLETPDEWMKEHGFAQEPDGTYGNRHPRFGGGS